MKNERLKQTAASLFVILSLVASSLAAVCNCASHDFKTGAHSHCEPQAEEHSAHVHSHEDAAANLSVSFSVNENCCCFKSSAPRVFAKSGGVKIEKQTAAISALAPVEFVFISPLVSTRAVKPGAPFIPSESPPDSTSGRAPPRS